MIKKSTNTNEKKKKKEEEYCSSMHCFCCSGSFFSFSFLRDLFRLNMRAIVASALLGKNRYTTFV